MSGLIELPAKSKLHLFFFLGGRQEEKKRAAVRAMEERWGGRLQGLCYLEAVGLEAPALPLRGIGVTWLKKRAGRGVS